MDIVPESVYVVVIVLNDGVSSNVSVPVRERKLLSDDVASFVELKVLSNVRLSDEVTDIVGSDDREVDPLSVSVAVVVGEASDADGVRMDSDIVASDEKLDDAEGVCAVRVSLDAVPEPAAEAESESVLVLK